MSPLERLIVGGFIGGALCIFGGACIGLATFCTPGEMTIFAFVFVVTCAWIGHAYGQQQQREEDERRAGL